MLKLIECPRDAMQGLHEFIPTEVKTRYINALLEVGFHTLDFGSFVSPKAIPQMQDTTEVLKHLRLENSNTRLLAIVANRRGADDAVQYDTVSYLGYPFSISETFQQRNTNRGIAEAFDDIQYIQEACTRKGKKLVTYISMGFGNPYGDAWDAGIVEQWVNKLAALDINIISLADTVGTASPKDISYLFSNLIVKYPDVEIGAHFHSLPDRQIEKIAAAYENGCRRFDSAMLGFGGCPMAADDLTGNISTDHVLQYLEGQGQDTGINKEKLKAARAMAQEIFGKYH